MAVIESSLAGIGDVRDLLRQYDYPLLASDLDRLLVELSQLYAGNERLADSVEQLLSENEQLMLLVLSYRREHGGECECAICTDVLRVLEGSVS